MLLVKLTNSVQWATDSIANLSTTDSEPITLILQTDRENNFSELWTGGRKNNYRRAVRKTSPGRKNYHDKTILFVTIFFFSFRYILSLAAFSIDFHYFLGNLSILQKRALLPFPLPPYKKIMKINWNQIKLNLDAHLHRFIVELFFCRGCLRKDVKDVSINQRRCTFSEILRRHPHARRSRDNT